jgi:hypothetical protein
MGLLDKIKDFGGSLKYGSDLIDQAENIIGVDKEDMNDSQRKKFRQILEDLYQDKQQNKKEGIDVSKGSTGGAVNKRKKGNKIISPKKNKKIKYAGRLAKRGYGKARK